MRAQGRADAALTAMTAEAPACARGDGPLAVEEIELLALLGDRPALEAIAGSGDRSPRLRDRAALLAAELPPRDDLGFARKLVAEGAAFSSRGQAAEARLLFDRALHTFLRATGEAPRAAALSGQGPLKRLDDHHVAVRVTAPPRRRMSCDDGESWIRLYGRSESALRRERMRRVRRLERASEASSPARRAP